MQSSRPIRFLITPAEDVEEQWNVVCLDFNIWTVGDSVLDAYDMICDAVITCLEDTDIGAFESADPEFWAQAADIIALVNQGRGIKGEIADMDGASKAIVKGVFAVAALCKDESGRWCIPRGTPPNDDRLPAAA